MIKMTFLTPGNDLSQVSTAPFQVSPVPFQISPIPFQVSSAPFKKPCSFRSAFTQPQLPGRQVAAAIGDQQNAERAGRHEDSSDQRG